MPRKRIERQNTSWRISVEAKRLLELMAERSGTSQSAVFEAAIREKARRERIALDDGAAGTGAQRRQGRESRSAPGVPVATTNLRSLAERIRSGDVAAEDELRRVIDGLRARATLAPAKRPEELDPEWRDRLFSLVEQIRAGVPAEWTGEELQEQIRQVVNAVRAERAGRH
jgi:hypothetical protein